MPASSRENQLVMTYLSLRCTGVKPSFSLAGIPLASLFAAFSRARSRWFPRVCTVADRARLDSVKVEEVPPAQILGQG
jgi:hypothetical protein